MNPAAVFEMGEASVPPAVAVCIATYQRPQFLAALLRSLAGMETVGLVVQFLVVDNDVTGSARAVVEPFRKELPELLYSVEPARGIAAARNRLVDLAGQVGAEFVAFVDDDEWVEPGWLRALVQTASTYTADAVGGPVLPEFDSGVPSWITTGGFFHRPRHQTGVSVALRSTSNLLIRRDALNQLEGPFDRRFDLTGGSDSHLLERLERQGARMVWCDEAVVHEWIPVTRGTPAWLLRRAYRGGLTHSLCVRAIDPAPRTRMMRVVQALARTGRSSFALIPALSRGRAATFQTICGCAVGIGGIAGALGLSPYQEYRHIHGR